MMHSSLPILGALVSILSSGCNNLINNMAVSDGPIKKHLVLKLPNVDGDEEEKEGSKRKGRGKEDE